MKILVSISSIEKILKIKHFENNRFLKKLEKAIKSIKKDKYRKIESKHQKIENKINQLIENIGDQLSYWKREKTPNISVFEREEYIINKIQNILNEIGLDDFNINLISDLDLKSRRMEKIIESMKNINENF
ncbi:MAG: hypothetical protein ACTSPW_18390 [Promethearchaeota archaeon]